jgi:hypothetical protein
MTDPVPSKEWEGPREGQAYVLWLEGRVTEVERLNATLKGYIERTALAGYRCAECAARLTDEPPADRDDAQRWRTYLKCYDQEEMVAAEWDGPAAITAFIDSQRPAQPPRDGQ